VCFETIKAAELFKKSALSTALELLAVMNVQAAILYSLL